MMDIENNAIPFYFSLKTLKQLVWSYFTNSVERGASTQVWLASGGGDGTLQGGEYLYHCNGHTSPTLWNAVLQPKSG
jgi:hypothetical protein